MDPNDFAVFEIKLNCFTSETNFVIYFYEIICMFANLK